MRRTSARFRVIHERQSVAGLPSRVRLEALPNENPLTLLHSFLSDPRRTKAVARTRIHVRVVLAFFLSALHLGSADVHAQPAATVAAGVQPFVDRQELAGAVMLVADKDKVLTIEAVGSADIAAQKPMQTDSMFGLGFSVGDRSFGHGGAYSTNTIADTERGLILVWLVQHAGFPGEGGKAQGVFKKAAIDTFTGSVE
jgi:CubicO group peptidase (beta-lactamase class C family)